MRAPRNRQLLAGAGGVAAATAAAVALERRHLRRVASDPQDAELRSPPSGHSLTVPSADGTRLHLEVFGRDGAQTIVLAHGWTESIAYWTYAIRDLGDRFRLVAFDLRGHGESESASGTDYSVARFGEDVEAVLQASLPDGERAVVVGHSLGAMSIAAWAEHHDVERRVSAVALLNVGVGNLTAESLLIPVPRIAQVLGRTLPPSRLVGSRAPLPRFSTPLSHAMVRYIAFGPTASPAQVAFYEQMLIACPPDVRADVGITLTELELHHALPRLTVPAIVLAGAEDRLTPPSHAERIAGELPQLRRLIVLPDTGHMAPLERPREVSRAIAALASEVGSGTQVVPASTPS
jgi:pimeloyl-ACP methyl ester carboxylesterase